MKIKNENSILALLILKQIDKLGDGHEQVYKYKGRVTLYRDGLFSPIVIFYDVNNEIFTMMTDIADINTDAEHRLYSVKDLIIKLEINEIEEA